MSKYNQAILEAAGSYLGLQEWPGAKQNPAILAMFADVGHDWVRDDETPWCAAFVGSVLASLGLPHTRKLNAKSYLTYGAAVELSRAVPGDIVVLWRGSREAATGHVAFFVAFDGNKVVLRGGNQKDGKVTDTPYDIDRVLQVRRADGKVAAPSRPTLRKGDRGMYVAELQEKLEHLRYALGEVDGKFGELTRRNVLGFQADHDLEADGVVGPLTWDKLNEAIPRPLRDKDEESLADSRTIRDSKRVVVSSGLGVGMASAGAVAESIQKVADAGENLGAVQGTLEVAQTMLYDYWPILLVVVSAILIYLFATRIIGYRVEDAQTGKHLGR
jgi:uncharacterized protein (TIGR02594 family)